jgi:ribosomal protein S18 acetylase RimI-like enzyme
MKYLKLYENFDELKITLLNSIDDLNKKEEAGEFSASDFDSDFDSGFKYLSIGVDVYANMKYALKEFENLTLGVIKQNNEVIGLAYLYDESPILKISGLEIKEDYRNKGFGRKSLSLIKEYAENKSFESIVISVSSSNESAAKLYRSFGFIDIEDEFELKYNKMIYLEMNL